MGQTKLSSAAAVAALERNLWSMWSVFGRGDGCRLIDEPGVMRFETPILHVPYNSVLRFQAEDADADGMIDSILAGYGARGAPVIWVLHPSARPADLGTRLTARGLIEAELAPGMIAQLDDVPATAGDPGHGVTIEEVGPHTRDRYLQLLMWRYALPPGAARTLRSIMDAVGFAEPGSSYRAWVARRGDNVISKVTLHLDGEIAGVYGVATAAESRGRGLASNLTARALDVARESGATTAVLHSTPMAVGIYESLGFEHVADFRLYSASDSPRL